MSSQPQLFNIQHYKTISSTYLLSLQQDLIQQPLFCSGNFSQTKGQTNMISRDSESLKYSDISLNSEEMNEIEVENKCKDVSVRLDTGTVDSEEQQQTQLISNKRCSPVTSRLSCIKGIQSLQQHLSILQKQLSIKDTKIKQLQQSKNQEEIARRQTGEKLLECECRVLELENIIIKSDLKGMFRSDNWSGENMIEKERREEMDRLEKRVEVLEKENDVLRRQVEEQHQLFVQYESGREVIREQKKIEEFKDRTKQHLSLIKHQVQRQLSQLLTFCSTCIVSISQKYTTTLQSSHQTILSLQFQLSSLKPQSLTDTKPHKHFKHKRQSLGQLCVDHNFDAYLDKEMNMNLMNTPSYQPTKLLKKQIMNAGKCINVMVNQGQVVKENRSDKKY